MAKLLKLRRGTTSQHSSFTGAEGEVTVDTDKDVLVVHDGSTAGGHPVAAQDMDNVPAGAILGTQLENSGVTAGAYGSSSAIPIVTVDAQGLVTAASTTAIDSTTIANGSASVAVSSNGPITSNANHDFSAGIDVTGQITSTGALTITNESPAINLVDSGNNPDWELLNSNGTFVINDSTNSASRLYINSSGTVDVTGNLDVGAGLDVTGNITATGTLGSENITITHAAPTLSFTETNGDPDYQLQLNGGVFKVIDTTNSSDKLIIQADGHMDFVPNCDFGAGIDVTGNSTFTGTASFGNNISVTGTSPFIDLVDSDNNSDYKIENDDGSLKVKDMSNSNATRLQLHGDGTFDVYGNLDANSGIDVTGNITATGNLSISNSDPSITITDTDSNSDFSIHGSGGNFIVRDTTNGQNRIALASDGTVDIQGNLDANGGLDVTGTITSTNAYTQTSTNDEKIILAGSSDPYIRFREGSTDKAYIRWLATGFLGLYNQEDGSSLKIQDSLEFSQGGAYYKVWNETNDGAGSGLDADTLDGVQGSDYATKAGGFNFSGNIGVSSSYPRIYLTDTDNNNDYSFINNNGNLLIYDDTANAFRMRIDGTTGTSAMHWVPSANNTYDLGTSSTRWRNVYTNDLHLSNEGHTNDVDGSWGNWTIQEGESDLFLKNNRSGKKYKFNLTEVS